MAPKNEILDGDDTTPPKTKAEGRKRGTLLLIIIGLLVMTVTPTTTYFIVHKATKPSPEEEILEKVAEQPIVMAIDPVTVNISGTRMTRVLRMQIHLVLSEPRLERVLKEMLPMVKDRIMSTAGRRTLDEMESAEDRESLKRDIALEINSLIRDRLSGSVLDVAFSEFLIQ